MVAAITAVAAVVFYVTSAPPAPPRHLIVVSIDTLRPDVLAPYGGEVETPSLERLASEGVLFENARTVAPTTLPAHASLFTATWPHTHGVRDNVGFYLADGTATLASHLRKHGYRTGGFVSAFVLDSAFAIDQGFEHYVDDFDATAETVDAGFVSQRSGEDVLDAAERWLADVTSDDGEGDRSPFFASEGDRQPFFAFVHLFEPHTPYEPPPGYARGTDDRSLYLGEVAYADALVGRLLQWLDERDLTNDTLIVVTSDHGESLGEHGEKTHGYFIYESTLAIPLVMRYPGAPAGTRVPELVRLVDVAPTVLELLDLPPLVGAEGVSVAQSIASPGTGEETAAFAESFFPRLHYGWSELRSIRRGRHKLIAAPSPELYDLEADPGESNNLFATNDDVAQRLLSELEPVLAADEGAVAGRIDRETRERLESLGYVSGGASTATPTRASELADPKVRLDVYQTLNDPTLSSVAPADGDAFESALERLEETIASEPAIPRARVLYGDLLLRAGRFTDAARNFRELIGIDGDTAW